MGGRSHTYAGRAALATLALTAMCGVCRADIKNVGTFSIDEFIPGAVNSFSVINFTFNFSVPPDFPVTNSVIFKDSSVILTDDHGTVMSPILIGDIDPGVTSPVTLQFADTQMFQSAEFLGTLNVLTFDLFGGLQFIADTDVIDALLLPSVGATLVAGVDVVPIAVTGTTITAPIPEPAAWLLLFTLLVFIGAACRVRLRNQESKQGFH